MKNNKETAPITEKEREDFWLEIGPASAYYGTYPMKQPEKTAMPARTGSGLALTAQSRAPAPVELRRIAPHWNLGMICRPSTGPEKSHQNKIHLSA